MMNDIIDPRVYLDDLLDELPESDITALVLIAERLVEQERVRVDQPGHRNCLAGRDGPDAGDGPRAAGGIDNLERVVAQSQRHLPIRRAMLRVVAALAECDDSIIEGVGNFLVDDLEKKGCSPQGTRVLALLSLFKVAEIHGLADAIAERQRKVSPATERTDESGPPPALGGFRTFTLPGDCTAPGFATAGDSIVCRFSGTSDTLPRSTARARKAKLAGAWFLVQMDNDGCYDDEAIHPMRVDQFGRRWLGGRIWNPNKQRFSDTSSWPRNATDRFWEVISIRRDGGQPYRGDEAFCSALQACGFDLETRAERAGRWTHRNEKEGAG